MSWYTDRAILAAIYQAAELYWITDGSNGRRDTSQFIQTRVNDAHALRTSITSTFSRVMNIFDATTSTASTIFRASRMNY